MLYAPCLEPIDIHRIGQVPRRLVSQLSIPQAIQLVDHVLPAELLHDDHQAPLSTRRYDKSVPKLIIRTWRCLPESLPSRHIDGRRPGQARNAQVTAWCDHFWVLTLAGGTRARMRRHRRRARAGRTKMPPPTHPMSHQSGKWRRTAAMMANTTSPVSSQIAQSRSTYCQRGRRLIHGRSSFSSSHRQTVRRLIPPAPSHAWSTAQRDRPSSLRRRRSAMSCTVLTEPPRSAPDTANEVLTTAVDIGGRP